VLPGANASLPPPRFSTLAGCGVHSQPVWRSVVAEGRHSPRATLYPLNRRSLFKVLPGENASLPPPRFFTAVTGQLAITPTCGLDNSRTGHLADATGDFACLVFVLLAASARPRVVQSASWRIRELSSYLHSQPSSLVITGQRADKPTRGRRSKKTRLLSDK